MFTGACGRILEAQISFDKRRKRNPKSAYLFWAASHIFFTKKRQKKSKEIHWRFPFQSASQKELLGRAPLSFLEIFARLENLFAPKGAYFLPKALTPGLWRQRAPGFGKGFLWSFFLLLFQRSCKELPDERLW